MHKTHIHSHALCFDPNAERTHRQPTPNPHPPTIVEQRNENLQEIIAGAHVGPQRSLDLDVQFDHCFWCVRACVLGIYAYDSCFLLGFSISVKCCSVVGVAQYGTPRLVSSRLYHDIDRNRLGDLNYRLDCSMSPALKDKPWAEVGSERPAYAPTTRLYHCLAASAHTHTLKSFNPSTKQNKTKQQTIKTISNAPPCWR